MKMSRFIIRAHPRTQLHYSILRGRFSRLAFTPAGAIHQQPRHCSNKHTSYSKLVHSICVIDTLLHVLISNNITQINKTEDCYIPQSIVVTVKLLTCILNRVPALCIWNVFMKIFYTAMILHKCVARFVIVSWVSSFLFVLDRSVLIFFKYRHRP